MKQYINVEKLETISDCLAALAQITNDIEDISLQLEYPSDKEPEWKRRAEFALRKCKSIRMKITSKLAVLRQQEKAASLALHQQHNDYLIDEMRRYLPRSAWLACIHRAKIKMEANHADTD